ncbi:hypothetical protein [uncultured Rhodoblastus sp.]|uniref:hypothetical protein n=1 Tax=uncultured Rhodoblastus sp. TaxID=543037 RepID=UPI0025FCBD6A|nr:hypothetical protein [uncultured Rhodoblastus sp.]
MTILAFLFIGAVVVFSIARTVKNIGAAYEADLEQVLHQTLAEVKAARASEVEAAKEAAERGDWPRSLRGCGKPKKSSPRTATSCGRTANACPPRYIYISRRTFYEHKSCAEDMHADNPVNNQLAGFLSQRLDPNIAMG